MRKTNGEPQAKQENANPKNLRLTSADRGAKAALDARVFDLAGQDFALNALSGRSS